MSAYRPSLLAMCVEDACGMVFSVSDHPSNRCPLCGSEAVNLEKESEKAQKTIHALRLQLQLVERSVLK